MLSLLKLQYVVHIVTVCHYTVSNIFGFLTAGAVSFISSIIDYLNATYSKVRYIGTSMCHLIVTCQILCYTSISVSLFVVTLQLIAKNVKHVSRMRYFKYIYIYIYIHNKI